jgi:tRNA(fMet)-specific endonuclease VapC
MNFMLDTNTCIYLIKHKPPKALKHVAAHAIGDVSISTITLAELQYGVAKSVHMQKNRQALEEFILPLEIAHFDEKAAEAYGLLRADLEKRGRPVGSMDMLIGAHALSLGVTLVTNNTKEFGQILDLKVVDWTV